MAVRDFVVPTVRCTAALRKRIIDCKSLSTLRWRFAVTSAPMFSLANVSSSRSLVVVRILATFFAMMHGRAARLHVGGTIEAVDEIEDRLGAELVEVAIRLLRVFAAQLADVGENEPFDDVIDLSALLFGQARQTGCERMRFAIGGNLGNHEDCGTNERMHDVALREIRAARICDAGLNPILLNPILPRRMAFRNCRFFLFAQGLLIGEEPLGGTHAVHLVHHRVDDGGIQRRRCAARCERPTG